jgi:hypothetical protein
LNARGGRPGRNESDLTAYLSKGRYYWWND